MKKLTALLLCFLLLCTSSVPALATASEEEVTTTVISLIVPDTHKITVTADSARVFCEGLSGEEFTVGRLSEPRLLIRAESGKVIKSVMLNGDDVTDQLHGGYLELAPVYEDKILAVITEDALVAPKETYTVRGRVSLNGQPLAGMDLELRSELMTAKTEKDGSFRFENVKPGKHSLTALHDGKVIGYLSFLLQKDSKTSLTLQEDGTYVLLLDQTGIGVELYLDLDEEAGALTPTEATTLEKPASPQTGDDSHLLLWWILLVVSAVCIVVLEIYRRKTKHKT